MDILAGIEATSTANSSLKQYMVTVNQLATATGLSPADLATSNTLGAALQALANNSIGNFIPMLSAGQSVPNIGSLNPIVVAAAAALSEQNAKSMFSNAQPLALSLAPMANFNELSNVLHSQLGQSHAPAEQHPKKEEQNVPTLVSLLASASVGTPQRQSSPRQRQMANSSAEKQTPTQPPPTKRSRLSQNAAQKEKLCERSKAFFGTSTDSEFPSAPAPSVGSPSGTKVPLTASLLSALTGVSAKFPLSAASPPVLPSPPQNSAQNSPTTSNTLVRRLSSVSASSSSTNGTGKTFGQTAMAIPTVKPRTPQRKPAAPIPNEKKDPAYFERRRKNNDAAKRSRDMRRQKEEQTAQRAAYLEQENIQLRKRVEMLSADLAKHRAILLSIAAPLTPPNSTVPFLTKSPPPEASVGEQRHCHVLASPTATKTMDGECHPLPRAVATVETEGHQIRLMKRERSETPTEDEGKCRAESDSAGEATAGENAPDHSLH